MRCKGATLVELLVVISILVLLAAITVPRFKPAVENRRARETARAIEAYLNRARVEAVERQRPVGIRFDRWAQQTDAAVSLTMVEMSPIYTGEDVTAQVRVQRTGGYIVAEATAGVVGAGKVATGDDLQLGTQAWSASGATYRVYSAITDKTGKMTITATLSNVGTSTPWPLSPDWSPYQSFAVRRQPVTSSVAAPLLLMRPMCIDLYESGTADNLLAGAGDVVVLFSPNGGLYQVRRGGATLDSRDVYFLLTTMDRLPATASPAPPGLRGAPAGDDMQDPQPFIESDPQNPSRLLRGWRDTRSLWVSVSYRSGRITTAEVAHVDEGQLPSNILPAGQFSYNGRDAYGQPSHLFWGLRKSRALAVEPMKGL